MSDPDKPYVAPQLSGTPQARIFVCSGCGNKVKSVWNPPGWSLAVVEGDPRGMLQKRVGQTEFERGPVGDWFCPNCGTKGDKPYFAPAAEGAPPEGEVPTWGEDAQAIAREAGLGSYGADPSEQELREDSLMRSLEQAEREVGLSGGVVQQQLTVRILGIAVIVLLGALIWVLVRR